MREKKHWEKKKKKNHKGEKYFFCCCSPKLFFASALLTSMTGMSNYIGIQRIRTWIALPLELGRVKQEKKKNFFFLDPKPSTQCWSLRPKKYFGPIPRKIQSDTHNSESAIVSISPNPMIFGFSWFIDFGVKWEQGVCSAPTPLSPFYSSYSKSLISNNPSLLLILSIPAWRACAIT